MALEFSTSRPRSLLAKFKKGIDDGHVVTWSYDIDGDFTHTPDQWNSQAWLRPLVKEGALLFTILPPQDKKISKIVYAVYHGRFLESMLSHCDDDFDSAVATAQAEMGDKV